MKINKEGLIDKMISDQGTNAKCPFCECTFTFVENDIENIIESIPYEEGIRKILHMSKSYNVHRYVSCPWCKSKLKLRLTIDKMEG